ncbi:hypothetical protein AOC36_10095 [Erysipelothrix larvae]|uniref:Uncharacterized protein n=1 Tax=Erysipelothrix larvae TaxID=1514105 RepID=A0A0X8H1M5_9FIRM|nr:MazG nucleotide pyrophosphohydrolase domain-containing protein [Erysipelothrix larvae]AMC94309.1 hypothetical protein AOC36_10095 [Erysipelothrix larvae]
MSTLTIQNLQDYLALKYHDENLATGLFMKLVEEVGETAEVLNIMAGRKHEDATHSLASELVDVIHYALAIATVHNIDLTRALIEKDQRASIKYNQSPNLKEFIGSTHDS